MATAFTGRSCHKGRTSQALVSSARRLTSQDSKVGVLTEGCGRKRVDAETSWRRAGAFRRALAGLQGDGGMACREEQRD